LLCPTLQVSSDPQKYTAVFLEMPNADYCAWVTDKVSARIGFAPPPPRRRVLRRLPGWWRQPSLPPPRRLLPANRVCAAVADAATPSQHTCGGACSWPSPVRLLLPNSAPRPTQHHGRPSPALQNTWGGGIELRILSDHYRREIGAWNIDAGVVHPFGEEQGYKKMCMCIYTG